jgi:hypothetical protein
MKKMLIITVLSLLVVSCTENSRVKNWGGKSTLELPKGQKLVNVTWKESELWYLTKPMTTSDSAETYYFQEESSWGVVEGTYVIVESK